MGGVLLSKNIERLLESSLLDQAVSSEISTRRISGDEILFCEETLRSSVVSSRKVDLGKPEGILVVTCRILERMRKEVGKEDEPVKASSLSPMKMAESY